MFGNMRSPAHARADAPVARLYCCINTVIGTPMPGQARMEPAPGRRIAVALPMEYVLTPHVLDETQPLIYMWEIQDASSSLIGRYVGKAKAGAQRPRNHYARNVANILQGRPYRKGNPKGYREVHSALANAVQCGHRVRLTFLCNVGPDEDINEAERAWIVTKNSKGHEPWQLNG